MSKTFKAVQQLVKDGHFRISEHGYDELTSDDIYSRDVIAGIVNAIVVEDYPKFPKGPCVLALQKDLNNRPIHVVWGIPKGRKNPAVLVTAYRPNPEFWEENFLRRRK